ncbi:MAG: hypothetical protein IPP51_06740 [Bacteroidetes bacterium]|nr:hypothetical protein [Bacteroidota bacterium]
MSEFIIISIVLILLFSSIRRFIFFNAGNAFNKAAEDFMKRQEAEERKRKEEGRVYVDTKKRVGKDDTFDDYTEIK